jgi:hypothetical protein
MATRINSFARVGPALEVGTIASLGILGKFRLNIEGVYFVPHRENEGRFIVASAQWAKAFKKKYELRLSHEALYQKTRNQNQSQLMLGMYF